MCKISSKIEEAFQSNNVFLFMIFDVCTEPQNSLMNVIVKDSFTHSIQTKFWVKFWVPVH